MQLVWHSSSLACLRPWVWSQRLRLLELPSTINKWTINSLTLACIYLYFTKLFSLCGLISNMTVLAAVAAHALGHIHTDPTEYLTLIKGMKKQFLFHNQGPSLSFFTLSGVGAPPRVVGAGLKRTHILCNLSHVPPFLFFARHQTSVCTELQCGGVNWQGSPPLLNTQSWITSVTSTMAGVGFDLTRALREWSRGQTQMDRKAWTSV